MGSIGGGLIFVRGDAVRGLATAAIVWITAAIGIACGAGLAILAVFATAAHFVAVFGYRWWRPSCLAPATPASVAVSLEVQGQPRPEALTASLSDLPGVHEVSATDPSGDQE